VPILVASFMVVLDFSIVNVALASIQRELGSPAAAAQWVVTGYAITFGGLLILGGRGADLFGRRRMFLAGLFAFTAASLAGGLAQDPVLLVAARAVAGHHRVPGRPEAGRDAGGRGAGRPGHADRAGPGPPGQARRRPVRTITGGMPR
jgi:MFS family permease